MALTTEATFQRTDLPFLLEQDIPDLPESRDVDEIFNKVLNIYIDGALCMLGLLGSILILTVFQRDKYRTSNSILLQSLAIADIVFLVYAFIYIVLRSADVFDDKSEKYVTAIVLPVGWTSQTAIIWITTAIAIDRYLIISRPLQNNTWCTVKTTRRLILGIFLASILYNIPRWPHYYFLAFKTTARPDRTFVENLDTDITGWDNDLYAELYHVSLSLTLLFIAPFFLTVFLNGRIVYFLKKSLRWKEEDSPASADRQGHLGGEQGYTKASTNITLVVILLLSIFLFCQLPNFINAIIGAAKFSVDASIYVYFTAVMDALLILNSAIPFYLYWCSYRRFRRNMGNLVSRRSPEKPYVVMSGNGRAENGHRALKPKQPRYTASSIEEDQPPDLCSVRRQATNHSIFCIEESTEI